MSNALDFMTAAEAADQLLFLFDKSPDDTAVELDCGHGVMLRVHRSGAERFDRPQRKWVRIGAPQIGCWFEDQEVARVDLDSTGRDGTGWTRNDFLEGAARIYRITRFIVQRNYLAALSGEEIPWNRRWRCTAAEMEQAGQEP